MTRDQLNTDIFIQILGHSALANVMLFSLAKSKVSRADKELLENTMEALQERNEILISRSIELDKKEKACA